MGNEGRGTHAQRKAGGTHSNPKPGREAVLLTGIAPDGSNPMLSHFRGQFPSGDFSLFILSGQTHTSHGDLDSADQFSISRTTPVSP